jgi:hypothetical protein
MNSTLREQKLVFSLSCDDCDTVRCHPWEPVWGRWEEEGIRILRWQQARLGYRGGSSTSLRGMRIWGPLNGKSKTLWALWSWLACSRLPSLSCPVYNFNPILLIKYTRFKANLEYETNLS